MNPDIISGGESGIGLVTAVALCEVGRSVLLWDYDAPHLQEAELRLRSRASANVSSRLVDLRDVGAIRLVADAASDDCGAIAGFVHAAGAVSATGLAGSGVRVISILPGHVRTPMLEANLGSDGESRLGRRVMQGRIREANEVGRAIRFLLSSDASYVTRAELVVDGGTVPSQRQ